MPVARTARARARAEITDEIKRAARRHVSDSGAAALSLRAVARELGFASSAVYRYFATRDDLLTALIVDAYVALGDTLEGGHDPSQDSVGARWAATCGALRAWATAHRQEWALLYGSPVPGYRAPSQTVDPATRVFMAFVRVVADAPDLPGPDIEVSTVLASQLHAVGDLLEVSLPPWRILATFQAIAQLIGAVSMELFGHLIGSMDPAEEFYAATVRRCGEHLRLY